MAGAPFRVETDVRLLELIIAQFSLRCKQGAPEGRLAPVILFFELVEKTFDGSLPFSAADDTIKNAKFRRGGETPRSERGKAGSTYGRGKEEYI